MTNPLIYVSAPVPEDCTFKISPSAFSGFIEYPHVWYRNEILGENEFTHNTSTVIGTIVHYCAEMVAKGEPVDKDVIEEYIDLLEEHETYSRSEVRQHYLGMAETLVNDYVLKNSFLEVETSHSCKLSEGYYVAGTLDRLEGTKEDCMIVDYKTYSSERKPTVIPKNYKYQLLIYAYMLYKKGYNVTRIRLAYINRYIDKGISEKTGKQLKIYPPEVTVLTETITQEDLGFIESLLQLCVDSIEATKAFPELTHVIWHDFRLRIDTNN